jgi:hypothetical protein
MTPNMWWEGRRHNEPTHQYLARVLEEVGLHSMAERARLCHFDDYFCPPEVDDGLNMHRLISELKEHQKNPATKANDRQRINVMVHHVIAGEFDGTKEESDIWANSKDGQATMRELLG